MSESRQQSQGTRVDLDALALRGEEVLDKILSTEIPQVQEERAAVSEDIAELETLRRNIDMLRKRKQNSLNTLVDVGGDTYMQATVSDCSMIFIDVGSKFFLQLTLDEAAHFLVKKKKILLTRLELAIDQTARVKAHAHLVSTRRGLFIFSAFLWPATASFFAGLLVKVLESPSNHNIDQTCFQ
eukprot:GHVT01030529.1.p1 GENE.GHVT01030529.1~~GHVT01030529.1.p1  ORF type:complete len:184 (-),score=28.67 GHVT01030529.1:150-701(-)